MQSSTIDGKSMTCMQSSSGSSTKTMPDSAWSETSTAPEKIKNFKRTLLSVEEEKSIHKTHANNILITADAKKVPCMQKMNVQLTNPTTNTKVTIHNSQAGRLSGAKHVLEYTEKTCMPHVSQPLKWLTVLQYNLFQLLKSSDEQEAMIQLIMPAGLGILEMRPGCWFYDISTLQKGD